MKHSRPILLAALVLALGCTLGRGQALVDLGSAANFASLAGSGITFNGATTITGDIGSYSTSTIAGAGNITFLSGSNHAGDTFTQTAKSDLAVAYDDAAGRTVDAVLGAELGSTTVNPGVYTSAGGTFGITGNLTLSGVGVYIFKMATTLDAAANSGVLLTNGATADMVYWQVGSSATFLTSANFAGNVLAFSSITVGTGTAIDGRLLAQNGAVTFNGANAIATPAAIPEPATTVALAGGLMGLLVGVGRWRRIAAARRNQAV
jgi:hypothetical protein